MAPKWLPSREDGGRRMSVISTRAPKLEVLELDAGVDVVPSSHFSSPESDRVASPPHYGNFRNPSFARKRYSIFTRNSSNDTSAPSEVADQSEDLPTSDLTASSPRPRARRASLFYRKRSSRQLRQLAAGADQSADPFPPAGAESQEDCMCFFFMPLLLDLTRKSL